MHDDTVSSAPRIVTPAAALAGYYATPDRRAFLADPARLAGLADAIAAHAGRTGVQALSWDVFDTALLAPPKSAARRLYDAASQFAANLDTTDLDVTPPDAFLARAEAGWAADHLTRPALGARAAGLDRIAGIVCTALGCPGQAGAWAAAERAALAEGLAPNPLVAELARRLPECRMLFLADTPLDAADLGGLLAEAFPDLSPAGVYSSVGGGGAKRSGGLYDTVAGAVDLPPGKILHLGKSLEDDFRMARAKGWQAVFLPLPESETAARRACHIALGDELAEAGVTLSRYIAFDP